jgi:hypothetical protein
MNMDPALSPLDLYIIIAPIAIMVLIAIDLTDDDPQ